MRKFFIAAATAGALAMGTAATANHHEEKSGEEMTAGTIVDVAAGNPDFATLVAAVTKAGLVETLSGDGPFTVFAPTDEAFAKLPEGTLDGLTDEQLTAILTYHVVPGKIMAADIAGQELSVDAVSGKALAVNAADGVKINDANVVAADVPASNGVIHVIDTVLMPPM